MRSVLRYCSLVVLLLASACGSIPQRELTAYTTAFGEAKTSGQAIVHDFAAAKAETERRKAARSPSPARPPGAAVPRTYSPPQNGVAPLTETQVRLLAWETIDGYNKALAALNAGESVEKVRSGTGRLVAVVFKLAAASGSAFPGAGALVDIAKVLAVQLEKARLTAEFKKAIRNGTPTVRKIFVVFRADTATHYQLRAALANIDFQRVNLDRGLNARDKKAKQAQIKAKIDELRKSLDSFNRLLEQTDSSLVTLRKAVDRPIDFNAETNRILDVALILKQHWSAYQNARSEAAK